MARPGRLTVSARRLRAVGLAALLCLLLVGPHAATSSRPDVAVAQDCPTAMPYRITIQDGGDNIHSAVTVRATTPIRMTGFEIVGADVIYGDGRPTISARGDSMRDFFTEDGRGLLTTGNRHPRIAFGDTAYPYAGRRYALTEAPAEIEFTLRKEPGEKNLRLWFAVIDGCGTWPPRAVCDAATDCTEAVIMPTAAPTSTPVPPTSTPTPTSTSTATPTNTPVGTATPTPTGTLTPTPTTVTTGFSGITTNLAAYPGGVPLYELIEVTFDATVNATSRFLPFAVTYPDGVVHTGVSVDVEYTQEASLGACATGEPASAVWRQPAFYGDLLEPELTGAAVPVKGGLDWAYPAGISRWRARFTPNAPGTWRYRLRAEDGSGLTCSQEFTFAAVANPANRGPIRVSGADPRYFEYADGTYFVGLGATSPGLSNTVSGTNGSLLNTWGASGMRLMRVWLMGAGAYGSSWGPWVIVSRPSPNEPQVGIYPPTHERFTNRYPTLTPPSMPDGGDYFTWLDGNEVLISGQQFLYQPCRVAGLNHSPKVPVKPGVTYRLRVRYQEHALEGPRAPAVSPNFGLAVKSIASQGQLWSGTDETQRCNYPGVGTTLANTWDTGTTPVDTANPSWRFLERTGLSFTTDHIPFLALTLENTKSSDGLLDDAGHVFIDTVELREEIGGTGSGAFGPNVIPRGDSNPHQSVTPRGAYAIDLLMAQARTAGVHIKINVNEKNDQSLNILNTDGTTATVGSTTLFYGDGRNPSQVRTYQQAWWRYAQARWGWSTAVHSWELLNEGDPNTAHYLMADEFGLYMKCRAFGVEPVGGVCAYQHPLRHPVTTSFFSNAPTGVGSPWGDKSTYPNLDYRDFHQYVASVSGFQINSAARFYDTVQDVVAFAAARGALTGGGDQRPTQRGELGYNVASSLGTDYIGQGLDAGTMLHQLAWAQAMHPGGTVDHYWSNNGTNLHQRHQYKTSGSPCCWDYRAQFGQVLAFLGNVPLTNGRYVDAAATVSDAYVEAIGQKDVSTATKRAHLWIRNRTHTWCTYVESVHALTVGDCAATVGTWNDLPLTGTVTLTGFATSTAYDIEIWQYARDTTQLETITTTATSDGSGDLVLDLDALGVDATASDIAVKIGGSS